MRINARPAAGRIRLVVAGAAAVACWAAVAGPALAGAAVPAVSPYGEVGRFGGFDEASEGAEYGEATTGLKEVIGEPAKFVYPVGMAVDTSDPSVPLKDGYAIYVLDLLNPQALQYHGRQPEKVAELELEYRIQKLGSDGRIIASRPFKLRSSATTPGLHAVSLAVDGSADAVYVLLSDIPQTEENETLGAVASYAVE